MTANEENLMYIQNLEDDDKLYLRAYSDIPYSLIQQEYEDYALDEVIEELDEICKYYRVYKKGKCFTVEGTNGDYVPANLKYRMCATLINKEARFLFAEEPDIIVKPKGELASGTEDSKRALTILNNLVKAVLDYNKFEDILIKAARDCFIGKRVACVVNFNEDDGVVITFLKSTQFIYETKVGNPNTVTKFVCFNIVKQSRSNVDKLIFKKKYTLEDDGVYLEEVMLNGAGQEQEVVTPRQLIKLDFIPAVVIINDGLTGEKLGESEVDTLMDSEMWYSKLSSADMDAERKSMNPTKYVVDMDNNSTKNLSTAAGALWDLGTDQNLTEPNPMVGLLEPNMSYSEALDTTLDRIKTAGYEQVDIPNITNDTLSGVITSGKALKAIYWPLIVRCKEKMKVWGPALSSMANIIIQGAIAYPNCIVKHISDSIIPVLYEIEVLQNTPLPEDEIEEKTTDLAEVESQVMSKKSYMKKWRGLTDDQVKEELNQIALERQILDDASFNNGMNGDNTPLAGISTEDFGAAGVNSIKKDGTQNNNSDSDKEVEVKE